MSEHKYEVRMLIEAENGFIYAGIHMRLTARLPDTAGQQEEREAYARLNQVTALLIGHMVERGIQENWSIKMKVMGSREIDELCGRTEQ